MILDNIRHVEMYSFIASYCFLKYDTWIGSGSIMLDEVTIKSHFVIAAGSVATKMFDLGGIVGGVTTSKIDTKSPFGNSL